MKQLLFILSLSLVVTGCSSRPESVEGTFAPARPATVALGTMPISNGDTSQASVLDHTMSVSQNANFTRPEVYGLEAPQEILAWFVDRKSRTQYERREGFWMHIITKVLVWGDEVKVRAPIPMVAGANIDKDLGIAVPEESTPLVPQPFIDDALTHFADSHRGGAAWQVIAPDSVRPATSAAAGRRE